MGYLVYRIHLFAHEILTFFIFLMVFFQCFGVFFVDVLDVEFCHFNFMSFEFLMEFLMKLLKL